MPEQTSNQGSTTPAAFIVLAWLIVSVPASWGIYNTVLNAKKLFTAQPTVNAAPQQH